MPKTFELISSQTLASSTGVISFTSIPGTFTDLVLFLHLQTDPSYGDGRIRFNGDSSNIYYTLMTNGNASGGSTEYEFQSTGFRFIQNGLPGPASTEGSPTVNNFYSGSKIDIFSYASSTVKKSVHALSGGYDSDGVNWAGGIWNSTAAITQIDIESAGGGGTYPFAVGSMATLYGIKAA